MLCTTLRKPELVSNTVVKTVVSETDFTVGIQVSNQVTKHMAILKISSGDNTYGSVAMVPPMKSSILLNPTRYTLNTKSGIEQQWGQKSLVHVLAYNIFERGQLES